MDASGRKESDVILASETLERFFWITSLGSFFSLWLSTSSALYPSNEGKRERLACQKTLKWMQTLFLKDLALMLAIVFQLDTHSNRRQERYLCHWCPFILPVAPVVTS